MKKNKFEGSCTGVSVGDEERVAIEDHSERECLHYRLYEDERVSHMDT